MSWFLDAFAGKSVTSSNIYAEINGDDTGSAGESTNITVEKAINISTVFACCRVLGEGLAQVPFKLMQESKDGKQRLPAKEHQLYQLLYLKPNRWQTSFEFREQMAWQLALEGNHYVFINRKGGKIIELYPLLTSQVTPEFKSGEMTYKVSFEDGKSETLKAVDVWHIRGPSMNGYLGLQAVKQAKEALALAVAADKSVSTLHKNRSQPSGVYSVEGSLNPSQYEQLSAWINKQVSGENAGRPLVIDRSAKWMSTMMSGVDAQTIENRKHQIAEICRYFRVSPIMIYGDDKLSTYAGSSESFKAHLTHTLAPLYQRVSQSAAISLLDDKERADGYYMSFVEEGMLSGTPTETKDVILEYVNGGIMTPNEGRAKLDMNPDPDPESDKLRIPANIVGAVPNEVNNEQP